MGFSPAGVLSRKIAKIEMRNCEIWRQLSHVCIQKLGHLQSRNGGVLGAVPSAKV